MKFLSKVKFLLFLVNIVFISFGVLFIYGNLKKKTISCETNDKAVEIEKTKNSIIDELTECQSNLFKIKNELEQTKLIPDERKNIISILLLMRNVEVDIGKKRNFSNDCVKLFSIASRIPIVQEYVLKYKDQFFKKNCIFQNNIDIANMIMPFQVQVLNLKQEIEQKDKSKVKRILLEIRYQITKLFVKSKIQKSDIEIAIDNDNYDEALKILKASDFERNDNFNDLYNAISILKNFKEMIYGIYDIIKVNN